MMILRLSVVCGARKIVLNLGKKKLLCQTTVVPCHDKELEGGSGENVWWMDLSSG